jgi:hypothetical protein
MAGKALAVDFKNPWQFVAEFNSDPAPVFADNQFTHVSENWRCLLDKVRTFFDENPAI